MTSGPGNPGEMRAAVLEAFDAPLQVRRMPVPDVADDEALVRVRATGLCGSDLKLVAGATPGTVLPLVPGHEVAGELVAEVDGRPAGQRVACYTYEGCGDCRWCRAGETMLCPAARRIGRNRAGGLAEYVVVRTSALIPFGEGTSFAEAAVAMDAVTTPLHALLYRARLAPGEALLVVGAGGLGLSAVQIGHREAACVAVVEPSTARREQALRSGAVVAVAPERSAELAKWQPDGADVVLEASGTLAGFELAAKLARRGGRVVFCGYRPGTDVRIESARLALDELTLIGCRAGRLADAEAALRAVEAGELRPAVGKLFRLEDVNEALGALRMSEVVGRAVVELP